MALAIAFNKASYDPGDVMTATVTASGGDTFAATWSATRSPGATVNSGLTVRTIPVPAWSDPEREWVKKSGTATTLILEATA